MSASGPQTTYYAERETLSFGDRDITLKKIDELKPRYIVLSIFEQHPDWVHGYVQENSDTFIPVQAFFLDKNQEQLALVIYEVKY